MAKEFEGVELRQYLNDNPERCLHKETFQITRYDRAGYEVIETKCSSCFKTLESRRVDGINEDEANR